MLTSAEPVRDDQPIALADALRRPYSGYLYAYPHKSTYRTFTEPMDLAELWRGETKDSVGVYIHVPFCEMRCGFCNLFTVANLGEDAVSLYLDAVEREARAVRDAVGPLTPSSLTLGGGTPTILDPKQLERLFDIAGKHFGADTRMLPSGCETSPDTATDDRLDLLADRNIGRISLGVQSFDEREAAALGRPQKTASVMAALDRIRQRTFKALNIDLIYGAQNQTPESWLASLQAAMRWRPEEVFLYPLYVRPLTGLDRRRQTEDEHRLALYRIGRDFLLAEGYRQHSMRMFRRRSSTDDDTAIGSAVGEAGDVLSNVIGIGCGARSRTSQVHYSEPFAVGRGRIIEIIGDYCRRDADAFTTARYGVTLDRQEQMRRLIALQILSAAGLDLIDFANRFGCSAFDVAHELNELVDLGLMERTPDRIIPTALGLERADAIGPFMISAKMSERMAEFERQ